MNDSAAERARRDALAPFADATAIAFRQFGETSERFIQLQMQIAAVALSESASRYAQTVNGLLRDHTMLRWGRWHQAAVESVIEPVEAWLDVVTGFQAIALVTMVEAGTLFAVQGRIPAAPEQAQRVLRVGDEEIPDRRFLSVVIPFPDRRRHASH